jgi:mono/diheme cytochrome c family protein
MPAAPSQPRSPAEEPSFHPYDRKYDFYLAGKAELSTAEQRGLKLFDDPAKGNCASCHIDRTSRDGLFKPAFTDYQFEALGAPRNRELAANNDADLYDLGLCGPMRKDYQSAPNYLRPVQDADLAQRRHAKSVLPQWCIPPDEAVIEAAMPRAHTVFADAAAGADAMRS